MTYFSLRKHEAEVDEDLDETVEGPEDQDRAEQPASWWEALQIGFCGPWRWLAGHLGDSGVTVAWIVHVGSAWAFFFYGALVAAGLALAWLAAFLLFVPREFLERAAAAVERRFTAAPKPPAGPVPGGEREAVRRLLLDVLGDADKVHLNSVLAHLQEHGQWEGKTVTDLRARLAHLGIPHDRKVKVAGVPTWGVRRAHLEAPSPTVETSPSPAPSPPV